MCSRGHLFLITPDKIFVGQGCSYCSNRRVLVGFNDLFTTRPDVAKLLKNSEDGYKYTKGSDKIVEFLCPQCGNIISKKIGEVCNRGLGCQMCSDGISYPNKLIRQVLKQLNVDFIPEYSPSWIKPKKYDCYFEYKNKKYIIEMDGAQHYYEKSISKYSLADRKFNDKVKDEAAELHDIKVIRIDCLISDIDYIRANIVTSELNRMFDLSIIDWKLCNKNAQKSLIIESCDLYMLKMMSINEIAKTLNICVNTTRSYLKKGAELGLCDYNAKDALRLARDKRVKIIYLLDDFDNIIHEFYGTRDCVMQIKNIYNISITRSGVKKSCQTHKPYKGFNFRFANETIQN